MSAKEEALSVNDSSENERIVETESIKNLEDENEPEEAMPLLDAALSAAHEDSESLLHPEPEPEQELEPEPELSVRHRTVARSIEELSNSFEVTKDECNVVRPESNEKASGSESDNEDWADEKEPLKQFHLSEDEESEVNSISSSVASRMAYARSCTAPARPALMQRPKPSLLSGALCNLWFVILELFEFITLFLVTLFNPNVDVNRQIELFNQRRAARVQARRSGSFGPSSSGFKPSFPGCGCGG
jgi:hypothetical protein